MYNDVGTGTGEGEQETMRKTDLAHEGRQEVLG